MERLAAQRSQAPLPGRLTTAGRDAEEPDLPIGLYSSRQLIRSANISYRQLDYWCRTELLCADVPANGSGTMRAFTASEVRVACALGYLSRSGFGGGGWRGGGFGSLGHVIVQHVRENGLTGTVTSADGVVIVNLDAIPDPMREG